MKMRSRAGIAVVLGFLMRRCEVCGWLGSACVLLMPARTYAHDGAVTMLCGACVLRRKAA